MGKIEVFYRESFSGECGHTGTDIYDGDIEMKDGGIWVYFDAINKKEVDKDGNEIVEVFVGGPEDDC